MANSTDDRLPPSRLQFNKGELVVKEGDYGISIYQVLAGKVGVFVKSGETEISVGTFGPGEIIGEMIFLTGHKTRRSASVRTLENSVLEAWHPERISKEYEQLPFIIRYITKQTVNHLIRMDNMISEFAIRKEREKERKKPLSSKPVQKRPFRKPIEMDCLYRPIESDEIVRLWGRIKNISKGGVRLNISRLNAHEHPHDLGAEFVAQAFFPNGKQIDIRLRVANSQMLEDNRTLSLGLEFVEMNRDAETVLGFFLM